MASIVNSKKKGCKVVSEILSDYEEFLNLQGHFDNIHLFTENNSQIQTNISQRGKNEATKYFLIPRQFRKGLNFKNEAPCQKLEFEDKIFFIYKIDKTKIAPSRRTLAIKRIEEKYSNPLILVNSHTTRVS